tara:strand:+ start:419 stop:631 length:213 start_codon:yes stop_codon:yes gene_type:complete
MSKRMVGKKDSFSYEVKMSKRKGVGVRWLVIERPTGSIIAEEVFEDKAQQLPTIKTNIKYGHHKVVLLIT